MILHIGPVAQVHGTRAYNELPALLMLLIALTCKSENTINYSIKRTNEFTSPGLLNRHMTLHNVS